MSEINKKNIQEDSKYLADEKNVLLEIVKIATKETPGVVDVYSPFKQKLGTVANSNAKNGAQISYNSKGKAIIDVYFSIYHNYNVPEVAYKVQKNIKTSLMSMMGYKIQDVNVHVVDAIINEEEK